MAKRKVKRKEKEKSELETTKDILINKYYGNVMELKVGSSTFTGTVTGFFWMGGNFLELNDGEYMINCHKIEHARKVKK